MNSRTARNLIIAVLLICALVIGGGFFAFDRFESTLRQRMVESIENRFNSTAEIQDLQIEMAFPRIQMRGRKLAMHYRGMKTLPPLISIDEFSASAPFLNVLKRRVDIAELKLIGLQINIPPHGAKDLVEKKTQTQQAVPESNAIPNAHAPGHAYFLVHKIVADGTVLRIQPKNPDKDPMEFDLYQLAVYSATSDRPLRFTSKLKNAKPPGIIDSDGEFGPWNADDPGGTPVKGRYTFQHADLSVFKGISGILSSEGTYSGRLNEILVEGTTDTPDFALRTAKYKMHLATEFHAIVDGTNGDTLLQPVKARLGEHTEFICKGGVYGKPGPKGKTVQLDVTMEKGRIEELLRLVVPQEPALVGSIQFHSAFELPPGDQDVLDKLKLKGTFHVKRAKFTSADVQKKIEKLSIKGRGMQEDETDERIVSEMDGAFLLRNGRSDFSTLTFSVPGAGVSLSGNYDMNRELIDFHGQLKIEAKLSETQKGFKSILLKVVDPFFRKNGKTVVPIKVQGSPKNVNFGLDM